jgi:hypothetical protein
VPSASSIVLVIVLVLVLDSLLEPEASKQGNPSFTASHWFKCLDVRRSEIEHEHEHDNEHDLGGGDKGEGPYFWGRTVVTVTSVKSHTFWVVSADSP